MSQHVTISPHEAADRLAIRELVEAYALCAGRARAVMIVNRDIREMAESVDMSV